MKNKKNIIVTVIYAVLFIGVVSTTFYSCWLKPEEPKKQTNYEQEKRVIAGKTISLKEQTIVFSSEESFSKFSLYKSKNNTEAQKNMINRGEAIYLPFGTKVNIIDTGIRIVKLETQNGTSYITAPEWIK